MTSCSKTELLLAGEHTHRRCRPLLGTFVEVTASGPKADQLRRAVEAAFAAIGTVQRLMSFHDPDSEVRELNRLAAQRAVRVSPWTHEVLSAAQMLAVNSAGAFDITIAPLLQQWGYLPRQPGRISNLTPERRLPARRDSRNAAVLAEPENVAPPGARARAGQCRDLSHRQSAQAHTARGGAFDIELLPRGRVRFRRPLQIDLGGIAKGFAVDRAIEELQVGGATSGCVNAGGDLRAFGPAPRPVHVRHPAMPGHFLALTELTDSALATSASYFTRKRWRGRWVSPLVDPRRQRACTEPASVSVQAPNCLLADALTKVVFADRRVALALLDNFQAAAFVVTARGEIGRLH
jgi:FAD:protein FMN transferase